MANKSPSYLVLLLRSAIFWIVFSFSVLIWWLPVACSIVLPLRRRYDVVNLWIKFNIWWLRVSCDIDYQVRGSENIIDPAIVFSKHQSTWETLALKLIFPYSVYVAKRELCWIPFFGWAFSALDYIYINRSAGRKVMRQLVDQGRQKLAAGFSITIFPEGTRIAVGAKSTYKIGGAAIAAETGAAILPVAHTAGLHWPRHSFIKQPGTIIVVIGKPIESAGKTAEQLRDEARDWIEAEMSRLIPDQKNAAKKATAA